MQKALPMDSVPAIVVEKPSPKKASKREAAGEDIGVEGGLVAYGEVRRIFRFFLLGLIQYKDMCGPCLANNQPECRSRSSVRYLTSACIYCTKVKKSCSKPYPLWVLETVGYMQDRNMRGSPESEYFD